MRRDGVVGGGSCVLRDGRVAGVEDESAKLPEALPLVIPQSSDSVLCAVNGISGCTTPRPLRFLDRILGL